MFVGTWKQWLCSRQVSWLVWISNELWMDDLLVARCPSFALPSSFMTINLNNLLIDLIPHPKMFERHSGSKLLYNFNNLSSSGSGWQKERTRNKISKLSSRVIFQACRTQVWNCLSLAFKTDICQVIFQVTGVSVAYFIFLSCFTILCYLLNMVPSSSSFLTWLLPSTSSYICLGSMSKALWFCIYLLAILGLIALYWFLQCNDKLSNLQFLFIDEKLKFKPKVWIIIIENFELTLLSLELKLFLWAIWFHNCCYPFYFLWFREISMRKNIVCYRDFLF